MCIYKGTTVPNMSIKHAKNIFCHFNVAEYSFVNLHLSYPFPVSSLIKTKRSAVKQMVCIYAEVDG